MNLRAFRVVASREIAARWILFPIVIALAMLIASIPYLVAAENELETATNIWTNNSLGPWVVAAVIGMSLLGNDHTESQLTFYFARPIAARDIYLGKLVGGITLALGAQAIFLGFGRLVMPGVSRVGGLGVVRGEDVLVTVVFVAVGMLVGIVVRSRTRWLAIDVAGVMAVGVAIAAAASHVHDARQELERSTAAGQLEQLSAGVGTLQLAMVVVALVGAVIAGWFAVAIGRTDRARTHAALSTTLWSIVVPATGVVVAVALRL
jgi:hypothetical protein